MPIVPTPPTPGPTPTPDVAAVIATRIQDVMARAIAAQTRFYQRIDRLLNHSQAVNSDILTALGDDAATVQTFQVSVASTVNAVTPGALS